MTRPPPDVPTSEWLPAPKATSLPADEVHVWLVALDGSDALVRSVGQVLSEDERTRAARFRFERDQRRYTMGRGVLRLLLGHYLGKDPGSLRFVYGRHGKPSLDLAGLPEDVEFNLSHSHGLGLYGFNRGRELGIDIEKIRPDFATLEVAERFFSEPERSVLKQLPLERQTRAFFDCWSRKEAFIKTRGHGLSMRLDSFDVVLHPDEPPGLLRVAGDPEAPGRMALRGLNVGSEFAAALVVNGRGWRLRQWLWSHDEME